MTGGLFFGGSEVEGGKFSALAENQHLGVSCAGAI